MMLSLVARVSVKHEDVPITQVYYNVNESPHQIYKTLSLYPDDIPLLHIMGTPNKEAEDWIDVSYVKTKGLLLERSALLKVSINTEHNPADYQILEGTYSFQHPSTEIIPTGVFNIYNEPLFWRHELEIIDVAQSIEIRDSNNVLIPVGKWKLIHEVDPEDSVHSIMRTIIAHNLICDLDKDLYYFVTYRNALGKITRKLLNQSPLFLKSPASAVGVDYCLNTHPAAHLLTYQRNSLTGIFEYLMPQDYRQKICYSLRASSYLHASLPVFTHDENWFPLVPSGTWKIGATEILTTPEYLDQAFLGPAPYMYTYEDTSRIVGKHFVKTSFSQVIEVKSHLGKYYGISLLLYKSGGSRLSLEPSKSVASSAQQTGDERPSKAITNIREWHNVPVHHYRDLLWEWDKEISVIEEQGIIYTSMDLSDYEVVVASYPYKSNCVPIYLLDINPFNNPSLLGSTIVYYMVPHHLHQTRAVEVLIYDSDGIITYMSQSGNSLANPMYNLDLSYLENQRYEKRTILPSVAQHNSLSLVVGVGENFIEECVVGKGYLILGEFYIPSRRDEGMDRIVTDVRRRVAPDMVTLAEEDPIEYYRIAGQLDPATIPIPELANTEIVKIHWAMFKDYVPTRLYTQKELQERMTALFPATITWGLLMGGVPHISIDIEQSSLPDREVCICWSKQERFTPDIPVSGLLYIGTTIDNIWQQEEDIVDLGTQTEQVLVLSSSSTIYYVCIRPYILLDGEQYIGPSSNIIMVRV
jgi:hypothetical protein